jgi:hypothetical protein
VPTPEIFDFDVERLADYNPARIDQVLDEHPALYINHLTVADHIAGWAERMVPLIEEDMATDGSEFNRGYAKALREVAAHLRQGDYVPSGAFMQERRELAEQQTQMRRSGSLKR